MMNYQEKLDRAKPVAPDEAERADYVVCVLQGSFTPYADNCEGRCAMCERIIIFRPHAPKTPPKICTICAEKIGSDEDEWIRHRGL